MNGQNYWQLLQAMLGGPQAWAGTNPAQPRGPMTPPVMGAGGPMLPQAGGPAAPLMSPSQVPALNAAAALSSVSPQRPASQAPMLPMAPSSGLLGGGPPAGRRRARGKPQGYRNPNVRRPGDEEKEDQPAMGLLASLLAGGTMPSYMGGNPYFMPGDRR